MKVGSTTEIRASSDVIVVSEPTLGATLRTKGRFYFLCEVLPQGKAGADVAREVADLVREQYEYDLSAGIEVAIRKALRDANRRAAHRLRDQHGRVTLHAPCAVLVNNELYAARIGQAQIFLVRRARLFLPGDDPNELADFVHRTTTRRAASLGSDPDLLPSVWKQAVEPGDTIILAGGNAIAALGGPMQTARERSARQQRLTSLLAVALLLVSIVIGAVVLRDFQANNVVASYNIAVLSASNDLDSAQAFIDRKPAADEERARQKV